MAGLCIYTRGDEAFGSGHLRRTSWIAGALQRSVVFSSVRIRCADSKFARGYWAAQRCSAELEFIPRSELTSGGGKFSCILADWLDSDPRQAAAAAADGCKIALLDDNGPAQDHAALVINSLTAGLAAVDRATASGRLVAGGGYVQIDPAVSAAARDGSGREQPGMTRASRILITLGGSPQPQAVLRLLRALRLCGFSGEVRVVPAAEARLERHGAFSAEFLPAADSLLPDMRWADLLISAGGITLYEAAALGLPCAALPLNQHQEASIVKLAAAGTCLALPTFANATAGSLAARLTGLLADEAQLAAMRSAGPAVIDGLGLERTVRLVEELGRSCG